MDRVLSSPIRILALFAALALVHGCRERQQLEKHAPALAHADFHADRIAVAGVVSRVPSLPDSTGLREQWSMVVADHLGRERFGNLPILSPGELRARLGQESYGVMLDRYKADGTCDSTTLADIHKALEGKARFVVFVSITDDIVMEGEKENEDPVSKKKTKVKSTTRTTWVRLHFYDLADQQLAWNHRAFGISSSSNSHDMTELIKHNSKDGVLSALSKSIVNSTVNPEPDRPPTPALDATLGRAIDSVGEFFKPRTR